MVNSETWIKIIVKRKTKNSVRHISWSASAICAIISKLGLTAVFNLFFWLENCLRLTGLVSDLFWLLKCMESVHSFIVEKNVWSCNFSSSCSREYTVNWTLNRYVQTVLSVLSEFYLESNYLWEDNHHSVMTAVKFFPVSFRIVVRVFSTDFYRLFCLLNWLHPVFYQECEKIPCLCRTPVLSFLSHKAWLYALLFKAWLSRLIWWFFSDRCLFAWKSEWA